MPTVAAVMTAFPYFVDRANSVLRALQLMEEHAIRHVAVKDGNRLVGIVSRRDLDRLGHPAAPSKDWESLRVERVMTPEPYVVQMEEPLAGVLDTMAERRLGTALVMRGDRLAGIVSVTDVCRALAEVLRDRFGSADTSVA